ncbi:Spc98p ASCRUDRAFT_10014 [Ascoidea rubescens DSM 1968]|uniref:Spindle pole body component n=1 Tax=Ascoidea rubescens DSM 1968 TaxID=1344418 RepID=A0A1D2VAH1_9ASCO|nr:hypothetical protein ASCRUDRAFT_10014 [Ascoidea rubescens DSM 1968]ODV58672.1 hypothetical protein ASCRUDRAFT_10014 [Ascoidea rubescens DSM 1968]
MSQELNRSTKLHLQVLIKSLLPNLPSSELNQIYNELLQYIDYLNNNNHSSILNPNLNPNIKSVDDLLILFQNRFNLTNPNTLNNNNHWIHFKNLLQLLINYKNLDQIESYLSLLDSFHDIPNNNNNVINNSNADINHLYMNPNQNFTSSSQIPTRQLQPNQINQQNYRNSFPISRNTSRRASIDQRGPISRGSIDFGKINNNNNQFFTRDPSPLNNQRTGFSNFNSNLNLNSNINLSNLTLSEIALNYIKKENPELINENEIINHLLFNLLGSTSELFPLTKFKNSINDEFFFKINIPNFINNSNSGLLHNILEVALIHSILNESLKINDNLINSYNYSQIKMSFYSQLSIILKNYIKVIDDLQRKNSDFINNNNSINSNNKLTLRKIYLFLFDEIIKFRFYLHLNENLKQLRDFEFLNLIYNYTKFNDYLIQRISIDFFKACYQPYLKIIINWVISGELVDKNNEFFINFIDIYNDFKDGNSVFNISNINNSININNVILDKSKVPKDIFSFEICEKIYQIGKTIIFLKKNCKELGYLKQINEKYCRVYQQFSNDNFEVNKNNNNLMEFKKFRKIIEIEYKEILNYFNLIIFKKFKMFEHIKNMKDFLFMGKGDFINLLIENSIGILDERSDRLRTHQLTKILKNSINESSINKYGDEYLNRIDARIIELDNGNNIGWDVFTLDYRINDNPISLILNSGNSNLNLREYLRMFNFLWKLKRIDYLLNESWVESNLLRKNRMFKHVESYIYKLIKNGSENGGILNKNDMNKKWMVFKNNRLNIMKNEVLKFLNKMINFFQFNIIEDNYYKLICSLVKIGEGNGDKIGSSSGEGKNLIKRYNQVILPKRKFMEDNKREFEKHEDERFDKFNSIIRNKRNYIKMPKEEMEENLIKENSIDELEKIYSRYLISISRNKILSKDSLESKVGEVSKKLFIKQFNQLINLMYQFINCSKEFIELTFEMIKLFELQYEKGTSEGDEMADKEVEVELEIYSEMESINKKLRTIYSNISSIYRLFNSCKKTFTDDLVSDSDVHLRNVGYTLQ